MSDTVRARPYARRHLLRLTLLLFAFLLITANGIVALVFVLQLRQANARMERSLRTILVLKEIQELAEESALDQHAYRVTGDLHSLERYRKERAELPEELRRLRGLFQQDGILLDRFGRLSSLIAADTAALEASLTPIELHPAAGSLPPELAASNRRSSAIVAMIDELITNEKALLDTRFDVIASRNTAAFITSVLAAIGSIVLIGVIFALMRRDLRRSERLAEAHFDALLESEQRLHRIFDESPIGIVLADADTQRIVHVNPAFCRLVGFDATQLAGKTITELTHVDDRQVLSDAIRSGRGPNPGIEVRYVTRSGAIAWANVHLTRLSAQDGRPGLLLALSADVTREKRVEAELRQAQKMEAIGQLTGGIAHDFNNLLGVIIGNVEFLIDAARDAEQAEHAREILNSALSGADLTRRLLAFARRQPLQPRRIDLNAYLPNHVAILRRLLGGSIAITTELAHDLWPIRADPSQIGDALLNLAINARDAMPHGGTIRIATANVHLRAGDLDEEARPGDYVSLAVTDTGTGMAPEVLERAVEPFFSTKAPRAGSGLGLSMIFGFAKQSGGHLRIDSELGAGTTVRLYLPRAEGVEQRDADKAGDAALSPGNETILLVDDNTEMRSVARRHLVSLGYRVSEADSGPTALAILRNAENFDLLLTDVVMPGGMTGYQLAGAARQLRPGLKVLFATGYFRTEPSHEPAGAAAGATIRKPYRRQELAATVRAVLEAS